MVNNFFLYRLKPFKGWLMLLATVVEGDQKAPFSIATTLKCVYVCGGATPIPGLLHFTLDPYLIMLSVKQGGIKCYFFESLV